MNGIIIYELREVHLWQNGEEYTVTVDGDGGAGKDFSNPLEAWAYFVDLIDMRVRRRIGNLLEHQGKNRYTGQ